MILRVCLLMMVLVPIYSLELFKDNSTQIVVRYSEMLHLGSDFERNVKNSHETSVTVYDYVKDNLAVGLEFAKYGFTTVPNAKRVDGYGNAITVRYVPQMMGDFFLHGYLDFGFGIIVTDEPIPESGTDVNFTEFIGLGFANELDAGWHFEGGVRYRHISNGGIIDSDKENPGMDNVSYTLGVGYQF